jgi:hypothetical protein
MTPRDYYRKLSHDITDAEIRLVAFTMADYVGEDNAIRLEDLCKITSMDERKVRMILERLVTEYHLPVCAHSGKAGRWLARTYGDAKVTQAEHYARAAAEKRRGDAYNSCRYPPEETGEIKPVQPALLDVPEPDIIPHWRW